MYSDIALGLMLGRPVIPEGFHTAIGKRLALVSSGSAIKYSYTVDADFFFYLETIRLSWRGDSLPQAPKVEIYRDMGQRAYQSGTAGYNAIDARNLCVPGSIVAGNAKGRVSMPIGIIYPPNTQLLFVISEYSTESSADLDFTALGRYVVRPEQLSTKGFA